MSFGLRSNFRSNDSFGGGASESVVVSLDTLTFGVISRDGSSVLIFHEGLNSF